MGDYFELSIKKADVEFMQIWEWLKQQKPGTQSEVLRDLIKIGFKEKYPSLSEKFTVERINMIFPNRER
jgi:hypothetical protein